MTDFFTAKISTVAPVSDPRTKKYTNIPVKKNNHIKAPHVISLDDSLMKASLPQHIEKTGKVNEDAKKAPEKSKTSEIILIDDDDEPDQPVTNPKDKNDKGPNTLENIENMNQKRTALVEVDEIMPKASAISKKLKTNDEEEVKITHKEKSSPSGNILSPYTSIKGTSPGLTPIIAIDCEMVLVEGNLHELARCSIVNYNGHVLFDKLIKPTKRVTNYLTFVSGITPAMMRHAEPYSKYRTEILNILQDRIIVGHSIKNDFDALNYYPPKKYVRDLIQCKKYKAGGRIISLKKMVAAHLKMNIQDGQHNSVEDARASLALYRLVEEEWEKDIADANYGMVRTVFLKDLKKISDPNI